MAHFATQKSFEGWEKMLPNQAFNSNLFSADDGPFEAAAYKKILEVCGIGAPQDVFQIEQTDMFTIEEMASSPIVLNLLQWILRLANTRSVLEIGSFVGVSAMYMASALPADGKVVTIEKFDHFAEIAQRNIDKNGLSDRIDLICADALEVLPELVEGRSFDFVFIDGNKERYADYLAAVKDSVSPGGIIVVDDALFHGDALNADPSTEKGGGVRDCLGVVAGMQDWHRTLVPISNGILLIRKPSS
jgi:predicted O-methyltransferase YrrM